MENTEIQNPVTDKLVINASSEERATFYRKTYMHVGLAILAFMAVESLLIRMDGLVNFMLSMLEGYKWLMILGLFWVGSAMAQHFTQSKKESTQYGGLLFYVLLEALIFLPLIAIAVLYGGIQVLTQAAIITLSLFAGLTAIVFMTKVDFSFLRSVLVIGTFIAIGAIVIAMIFGIDLGFWFSIGMSVFAAAAILYETNKVKYKYECDQHVAASVGIFASVMLLFWYILNLLLSRD